MFSDILAMSGMARDHSQTVKVLMNLCAMLLSGLVLMVRPKKINVLFPISSPICFRVGRLATFFFSLLFFSKSNYDW